jgi:1-deoxy-D-xylulose-5-phosphate synthase
MAVARDLGGETFQVIGVIGDGSLTGGMALEALNQIGHQKRDILVVLNDNGMAISESVGAWSQYLNRLITAPLYNRLKDNAWNLVGKLPPRWRGRTRFLARKAQEGLKSLLVPNIIFEELGLRYVGPMDGHDISQMVSTFRALQGRPGPHLVHVITLKGKGYCFAENDACKFHGVSPFDPQTGTSRSQPGVPSYTEVFARTLVELADEDRQIIAITAAMPEGTGTDLFRRAHPDRYFDVGIAEQHAVTFAAGLATRGIRPVVAIYSTFLQRAFDQIIHDVALQRLPVVFAIDRGGVVGDDGPTHHGAFDLSYLRAIPNLVVMAPKDEAELRHMLRTALAYEQGPVAIRYPRGSGVGSPLGDGTRILDIGRAEVLRSGKDLALLGIGATVYPALEAARLLENEGIECAVVNCRFVKPLDTATLGTVFKSTFEALTIEDNVLAGGFGSAVMEAAEQLGWGVRVHRLGYPDLFIEHATRSALLEKYGLTATGIARAARDALGSTAVSGWHTEHR